MRITIAGGGNIGTQFAVHCAEAGHDVIIKTPTPQLFDKKLQIVNEEGKVTHEGYIRDATDDPNESFKNAELILVTVPATMMEETARAIYENVDNKAMIGVVPGNGGSECAFKKCIERGNVFFGIERVPAIARIIEKGRIVRSVGYREELHVAGLPHKYAKECSDLVSRIFNMPCKIIPNYLNLTMTPSNPLLHTARLKSMFSDWAPGRVYESVPLFYEEWDEASSELLMACDREEQQICKALPELNLQYVVSLPVYYESRTAKDLTRKLSSISAFKGILAPMIKIGDGYIPDLSSRYFTADFSYGLEIIKQLAVLTGVYTPNIDSVLDWYSTISVKKNSFSYSSYGIVSREQLVEFYLQ